MQKHYDWTNGVTHIIGTMGQANDKSTEDHHDSEHLKSEESLLDVVNLESSLGLTNHAAWIDIEGNLGHLDVFDF